MTKPYSLQQNRASFGHFCVENQPHHNDTLSHLTVAQNEHGSEPYMCQRPQPRGVRGVSPPPTGSSRPSLQTTDNKSFPR